LEKLQFSSGMIFAATCISHLVSDKPGRLQNTVHDTQPILPVAAATRRITLTENKARNKHENILLQRWKQY